MIKYIGSKRTLVATICDVIEALTPKGRVVDVFSGTSRVGHALKSRGWLVTANDHNAYAYTLARCYVQADSRLWKERALELLEHLQNVTPAAGWFTETYCIQSRFFQPHNGAKIDAIREELTTLSLPDDLQFIALTSLMEAADRVDSTTGVQMAYLKDWAQRSYNDLELRLPDILPGEGEATLLDAKECLKAVEADVAYLDPPYNQHKYLGNYHIWESLVLWDKPEVYGVACKRVDVRERSSDFNSKPKAARALEELISAARVNHLVVSFSDEGYISKQQILDILGNWGDVRVIEQDYKRYVGAQIGIHNQKGEKVGKVSHLRNKEYIFTASR